MTTKASNPDFDEIATRTYSVEGKSDFIIRLGRPRLEPNGETWRSDYKIESPSLDFEGHFSGIDGFQALLNAIYCLEMHVATSDERQDGLLSWDGQSEHFGLPPIESDPGTAELQRIRARNADTSSQK